MKKMMIIAAMVSIMLMPAQVYAQGNRNDRGVRKERIEKQRVEKRKDNKKGAVGKVEKNNHGKKYGKNHKNHKPAPKPVVIHKPAPKPIVIHKPAPKPVIVEHNCHRPVYHVDGNAVNAAAVAVGIVGLVSLLAD